MTPLLSSTDREYPDYYPPEGYFKPYWRVTQPELEDFADLLDTGIDESREV